MSSKMIITIYNNNYVHVNKSRHCKNKSLLTEYHEYMMLYNQPDTHDCLSYYKIDHENGLAD